LLVHANKYIGGGNMKKNIGSVVGMYPTPSVIVGVEDDKGKINWINIAHIGILGVDKIILTMSKTHYTNEIIKENGTLSINMINEKMLIEADYVGIVSGKNIDKSNAFEIFRGELQKTPLIKKSPISMECRVIDNYETNTHDNFIVDIRNTYVDDNVLSNDGKIDYTKAKPILFEMPNRQYLSIGEVVGKCWDLGKNYKK
jgi:flavin reductase (DIM6/NTAB) family NADH-FMN oxidoreductase RutF